MASSLEKLASYLDEKNITNSVFMKDGYTEEQIKLLRKGVYRMIMFHHLKNWRKKSRLQRKIFTVN